MIRLNRDRLLARLTKKQSRLITELEQVNQELAKARALPVTENKFSKTWERRKEVYELVNRGLSFVEIAKKQNRHRSGVRSDYWSYEQRYAPLCLITTKGSGQPEHTWIGRFFSEERLKEEIVKDAQVTLFEQFQPLVWNSFYHGGGSQTECGSYEIVYDPAWGCYSNYIAIHVASHWESPPYSSDHSVRHERKWLIDDVEIVQRANAREGAKGAAEIHAIASWQNAKPILTADRLVRWNSHTMKWTEAQ